MNSLKLKTKLLYLLLSVGFGLIVIGLIGFYNLSTMKKHVDTLYFGSLIPLTELTSISSTYRGKLESPIYQWKHNIIDNQSCAQSITTGLDQIDQMWASYLTHHKRPEEMPYVDYTESQIEAIRQYLLEVRKLCLSKQKKNISLAVLSDNISSVEYTINQLLSYEISAAKYERSLLLSHHHNSTMQLLVLLGVILIGVMTFAWRIFIKIELQQRELILSSERLQYLNMKLEQASFTDSLTGLSNRRHFNMVYMREFKRAKRQSIPLTFMMIDIDYFKQYNDTYGHIKGDDALHAVAEIMKHTFQRPGDFTFRLGGEEFGVILADTDCHQAKLMAEKLRDNVEQCGIEHLGSKVAKVLTLSIGSVCIVPSANHTDDDLIHSADTNLYAAKERGRNQVVISSNL